MRKLFIGIVSLAAVAGVYLFYSRLGQRAPVDFDKRGKMPAGAPGSGFVKGGGAVGRIGQVGLETVRAAKYVDFNTDRTARREFGFDKVIHDAGEEWAVEKPYMNIFQRSFECYITADNGQVQVESAGNRHSPKDARLTGNVVIRIVPRSKEGSKESRIYLDDVDFISEKSQFSTGGPVKFVSPDAEMLGRGLELVYNSQLDRVEYLRVVHIESLRLRSSRGALFGSSDERSSRGVSSERRDAGVTSTAEGSSQARTIIESAGSAQRQKSGEYYKCVFSKRVFIDTPEQLIFAEDEISIDDVFWAKPAVDRAGEPCAVDVNGGPGSGTVGERSGITAKDETQFSADTFDVVVTCENGMLLVPAESGRTVADFPAAAEAAGAKRKVSPDLNSPVVRTTLVAGRIGHSALTEQTLATGPLELAFCPNDVMVGEGELSKGARVPVRVAARDSARFLPGSRDVIFEGNCRCTMVREDANSRQEFVLTSPMLAAKLAAERTAQMRVEQVTASGSVVRLATVKTGGGRQLGGVELKCRQFDYDTNRQVFFAAGPGVIKVDHSSIAEPNSSRGKFSFRKPCWALVQDFETLEYRLEPNVIVADAGSGQMNIGYVPVLRDGFGKAVKATAAHLEASLYQTAQEQLELSTLTATGGVNYEDGDKQFSGGSLFYDAGKSILQVRGDGSGPCYFNGAAVDGIEWDLKSDKLSFDVVAPGAVRVK